MSSAGKVHVANMSDATVAGQTFKSDSRTQLRVPSAEVG